jgi:hypothetical protein
MLVAKGVRPAEPTAQRADEDQAVIAWLGEALQVPAQLVP